MRESGGVGGPGSVHRPVCRAAVSGCYASLDMLRASPEAVAVTYLGAQKQGYWVTESLLPGRQSG